MAGGVDCAHVKANDPSKLKARKAKCLEAQEWWRAEKMKSPFAHIPDSAMFANHDGANQKGTFIRSNFMQTGPWGPPNVRLRLTDKFCGPKCVTKNCPKTCRTICEAHMSFDLLYCNKVDKSGPFCAEKYSPLPDPDHRADAICQIGFASRPVSSTLLKGNATDGCKSWFTALDGSMRAFISGSTSAHVAMEAPKCMDETSKAKVCCKAPGASHLFPEQCPAKGEVGDALSRGRRASNFGSISQFLLAAGSNRAGNDEALL